jgi:hypothetical protein
MLVRVLKTCFVDGGLRTAGTQFDWSGKDKAMGKHFSPVVDETAAAEAAPAAKYGRQKKADRLIENDDLV